MNTNSGGIPNIVRVKNYQQARYEAGLQGKLPHAWKYIGTKEQLKGYELKEGITYYIDYDIPELEVLLRMR